MQIENSAFNWMYLALALLRDGMPSMITLCLLCLSYFSFQLGHFSRLLCYVEAGIKTQKVWSLRGNKLWYHFLFGWIRSWLHQTFFSHLFYSSYSLFDWIVRWYRSRHKLWTSCFLLMDPNLDSLVNNLTLCIFYIILITIAPSQLHLN